MDLLTRRIIYIVNTLMPKIMSSEARSSLSYFQNVLDVDSSICNPHAGIEKLLSHCPSCLLIPYFATFAYHQWPRKNYFSSFMNTFLTSRVLFHCPVITGCWPEPVNWGLWLGWPVSLKILRNLRGSWLEDLTFLLMATSITKPGVEKEFFSLVSMRVCIHGHA